MAKPRTLFQMLFASASLVVGGGVGPLLTTGQLPPIVSDSLLVATDATLLGRAIPSVEDAAVIATGPTSGQPVAVGAAIAGPAGGLGDGSSLAPLAQTDADEPLDAPLEGDDDDLDEPVDEAEPAGDDPLDAPLEDESAVEPVAGAEPLDAPLDDVAVDLPDEDVEALDAPLPVDDVAVVPVAGPVAKPKSVPVATTSKPVTSVRKKGAPQGQVVVVAGRRPLPADLATCDVVVGAGRATVGSDCEPASVVAGFQPAIPRVPGSAALISTEDPSLITSRRDGIQIGSYPEPTLGDTIATTVRAAIFPEDVIVPEILIVPGEVVVAGNRSREDPIVLWRSELESAAVESGIPIEMLATVISMTAQGNPDADIIDGRVGPMQVPVAELEARGISEDQWLDPATNISVGAELLATGASAADVQSGAAVTHYLTGSCGPGDACSRPESSDISELIVYYRLRATSGTPSPPPTGAQVSETPGWPFGDGEMPAPPDPRARLRQDDERDADRRRDRPDLRLGDRDDEPAPNWPWAPDSED